MILCFSVVFFCYSFVYYDPLYVLLIIICRCLIFIRTISCVIVIIIICFCYVVSSTSVSSHLSPYSEYYHSILCLFLFLFDLGVVFRFSLLSVLCLPLWLLLCCDWYYYYVSFIIVIFSCVRTSVFLMFRVVLICFVSLSLLSLCVVLMIIYYYEFYYNYCAQSFSYPVSPF